MIDIDKSKCKRCNLCFEACPDGIIAKGPELKQGALRYCVLCGHCAAICPAGAITIAGFDGIETPPVPRESPVGADAMMALLRRRRSGRIYKPEPVSKEHLQQIVQAASLAPSAMNARPVKAYVYADSAAIAELRGCAMNYYRGALRTVSFPGFSLLWKLMGRPAEQLGLLRHGLRQLTGDEKPDPLLYGAPALLAFTVPRKDEMGVGDAWLAAQNAALAAESLGVATCYNGFLAYAAESSAAVKAAMRVPKSERVVAALTMGYPRVHFLREAPRKMMPTTWM